jgi:hypothetical protein
MWSPWYEVGMDEAVYFRVPENLAVDPAVAPRDLPRVVARGTRSNLAVGLVVAVMGLFLSGFGASGHDLKLALGGLPFVALGAWMVQGAVRRRRTARTGNAVPAKMYLMDAGRNPVEMKYLTEQTSLPSGSSLGVIQSGVSMGTLRAVYDLDGKQRDVWIHLEPGELPVPVRWGTETGMAVLVPGNSSSRGVPWTDAAPSGILFTNGGR